MTYRFLRGTAVATLAMVLAVAMVGCYESPSVTVTSHEPGHYKGKVDPLLAKLDSSRLQQQLKARSTEAGAER